MVRARTARRPAHARRPRRPAVPGRLVVENPATSSPGLAFLLATVAQLRPDGWNDYWQRLRANGVKVVDGWEQAYDSEFSAGSGQGDYPLVVSYASSPPAEVYYADPKPDDAPTGALTDTCFRQVEFAGVLRGAAAPGGRPQARRLHAQREVPGRHPAADVRVPGADRNAASRASSRSTPTVPAPTAHAPAGPDRRAARRLDRRSGPTPCCGDARRVGVARSRSSRVPVAFLAVFFVWPVIAILERGLAPDGALEPRPARRRSLTDPALRHVVWFTVWQAVAVDGPDRAASASPARSCSAATGSAVARVVRALVTVPFVLPDGGRRRRVPAPLGVSGSLGGDPARARVLQLRGRGAHGRRALVAPRPAARRSGPGARREPVADVRRRDAARAAARDHRGRVDRLPLLLHLASV